VVKKLHRYMEEHMTALCNRKSKLVFETEGVMRERGKLRQVIIEASASSPTIGFVRLKGTQTRFPFEWAAVYTMAAKIAVAQAKVSRKGGKR